MSRGPGSIERAIGYIFTADPHDAYSVEDLIDCVFGTLNLVEKKHRVSVIRAAKNVCRRNSSWSWEKSAAVGEPLVFWNRYDVMSYATMRVKTDMFTRYRSNDPRVAWARVSNNTHTVATAASIRDQLAPGGSHHHHVIEGGAWWRHVQINIADRDGDQTPAATALREQEAANRAAFQRHTEALMRVVQSRVRS